MRMFSVFLLFCVACDDHEFKGGHTTSSTDSGDAAYPGEALITESCTSSCHAGADMGGYSSRYPDDEELRSIISGEAGGPMESAGFASASWSDDDWTDAIEYLRSLE
ncbi:MAG: hypothetical protein VX278_08100 [Myxococcota bacterium]|nr:hypothetical protein [Myxococcota bacterium]